MPYPEITPHKRNLRTVFWSGRELAVHVARLSVLLEDLRLESTAARFTDPIPQIDTTTKNYRYWYFLHRMLVTLDEFASASHQINANDEWKRYVCRFETICGPAVGVSESRWPTI